METNISHNKDGTTTYVMVVKLNTAVKQEEIFSFLEKNSSIVTPAHAATAKKPSSWTPSSFASPV